MNKNVKNLLAAFLFMVVVNQGKICQHQGFSKPSFRETASYQEDQRMVNSSDTLNMEDHIISDTIYRWDDQLFDWVAYTATEADYNQFSVDIFDDELSEPITVNWEVLMDVSYKLKYFKELGMEIYAPVFSRAAKALHEKEVIIEGFVIPMDEEGDKLSLSYNPYASCFFCGQASPASVISMYLKDTRHRYKTDDYRRFKGVLYLNEDDPNEFYYILRDATES